MNKKQKNILKSIEEKITTKFKPVVGERFVYKMKKNEKSNTKRQIRQSEILANEAIVEHIKFIHAMKFKKEDIKMELNFKEQLKKRRKILSIQFGIIGLGQGGGRIAAEFYKYVYPVMLINTSEQDLKENPVPDEFKITIGDKQGAGKDMIRGSMHFKNSESKIMSKFNEIFQDQPEHILLVLGLGGGTGSGGIPEMIRMLEEYGYAGKMGVIGTLPLDTEDSTTKLNALKTLEKLVEFGNSGIICPLIIIDNNKIEQKYPNTSIRDFWNKANHEIVDLLDLFNVFTKLSSHHKTFDPADFKKLIKTPHCMVFGTTTIENYMNKDELINAIDNQLEKSLLASGFNLVTAKKAGVIIATSEKVLSEVPRLNIEAIFENINKKIGAGTVFGGVYASTKVNAIHLFTMYAGMDLPKGRIAELVEAIKNAKKIEERKEEKKETVSDILKDMGIDNLDDLNA
ncbi:MAG: hypothetical protein ACTSWR_00740 [Candidatus Helarchaeota archaeon]